MENEIWKDIPGFEGLYQASTKGQIRSIDRVITRSGETSLWHIKGKILSPSTDHRGYLHITLMREGKKTSNTVHRLIGLTFLGESPEGHEVDHINQVRDDNRVENLRWLESCTNRSRGSKGRHLPEYRNKMENNPRAKRVEILRDGVVIGCYECAKEITKSLGVNYSTVRNKLQKGLLIINDLTYRYATNP